MPEITTTKFYEVVKIILEQCKHSEMFEAPRLSEFKGDKEDYVIVSNKKNRIFSFYIIVRDVGERILLETFDATLPRRYFANSDKTRDEVLHELNSIVHDVFDVAIVRTDSSPSLSL